MNIRIAPSVYYISNLDPNKTITVRTMKWTSPKNGENGLLTFFKHREEYLKNRGIKEVEFSLYSMQQCKECEIVNADSNMNYFMIRFGEDFNKEEFLKNKKK